MSTSTKFRPQRGGYAESMAETVEVSGVLDLGLHLKEIGLLSDFDSIEIRPYGFDRRNGWDTHLVSVNGAAVGFTDGPLALPASTMHRLKTWVRRFWGSK